MNSIKDQLGDTPFEFRRVDPSTAFGGATYSPKQDYARLTGQLKRVFEVMKDGQRRTLAEISSLVGASEAAASARLRDLRKEEYGGHTVERFRVGASLWEYQVTVKA